MSVLQALFFGDVACLDFEAHPSDDSTGNHSDPRQDYIRREQGGSGNSMLGYILSHSFGKVVPHGRTFTLPPSPDQSTSSSSASSVVAGLDHHRHHHHHSLRLSLEEAFYLNFVDKCLALKGEARLLRPSSPRKRLREAGKPLSKSSDDDQQAEEFLSAEEAWRYCCGRRQDFPLMFVVYRHFRARSFTVQAGHKYGAHFVLYEGPPDEYHSRYCVHVRGCASSAGGGNSWGHIKTMTRLMPDVAKSLLLCGVSYAEQHVSGRPSSPVLDTSSLAALEAAKVTALTFGRSRDNDPGITAGSSPGTTALKGRGVTRRSPNPMA